MDEEIEADIEKIHHTLQEDKNEWQYGYIIDSEDDDSDDDENVLYIDLERQGSVVPSDLSVFEESTGQTNSSGQSTSKSTCATESEEDGDMFREVGVMQEELDSFIATLPAGLDSCLILNRAYQDVIAGFITKIDLELAENREAQKNIEEEAKESSMKEITKKRFPYSASMPYFKMKFGSTPSHNEDVRLKRLTDEPDLDIRPEKIWHGRQKCMLREAVIKDSLERLLQPLLNRRELEESKLSSVGEKTEAWHQMQERIACIDRDIEEKRQTPNDILLQFVDPEKVDWMKISNMTFDGKRDWLACRRAWEHSVDPRLNQTEMTVEEGQRLFDSINIKGNTDWVNIAEQLGTRRTPFQCLQYFQQNLNPEMFDRPWTQEEDAELITVVEKCKQYHFNWRKVSHYMEGRSGMQCYKRYSKLDPNIRTGHWTETEDGQLMTAVHLLGTHNWGRVKELVPGRTREQCRERYLNCLDPSISGMPWTYEEDKKLLNLVEVHGLGNWVKCVKELPGRTDNQALQRYRRLQDWKRKSEWFTKQSERDRNLLQGDNLPKEQKERIQLKNWDQFRDRFGVLPEDYVKQRRDIEKGDTVVPRPPFMIGLANRSGSKVWERRIQLHKLIESHIDKLKDRYNFIHPSVAGVFELQDAISQLSKDCISQRDYLMNKRKDNLGQLIHDLPSVISVKQLLTVSRGGKIAEKKRRGPQAKKKKKGKISFRLMKSIKVESELRKVVRANLKDRSFKKGRPRRFFWDITGDQILTNEEITELKSTAFSLYLKSLGADLMKLLQTGRKAYPELYHRIQQQQLQQSNAHSQPSDSSPSTSGSDLAKNAQQALRRSQRRSNMLRSNMLRTDSEHPTSCDPFSLSGYPLNSYGFAEWQRRRDYELLEWLAQHQHASADDQLSEGVSQDIPTAASVEISSTGCSSMPQSCTSRSGIGQGMSLVQALVEQAAKAAGESITRNQGTEESTATEGGAGSAGEGGALGQSSLGCHQQQQQAVGQSGGALLRLPNLPPTYTSLQSFKTLLLKRLSMIKKASTFYNLPYYLAKKDQQMATLISSGAKVQELNRGTIDLSRMMNRISQETDYNKRKKRTCRVEKQLKRETPEDIKQFDYRVLESVRETPEFQTLQSRFLAVFTWPSLLSAIYPPFQRKDFSDKAGGQSFLKSQTENEFPSFISVRKRLPLLKTKAFYRYINKTKEEKEELEQKKEQRRILKEVKRLMADEDNPNPKVTYESDSDDETSIDSQPGPSKRSVEDNIEETPPQKKRRIGIGCKPSRKSVRVTHRKTYVDSINKKRSLEPRKKPGERIIKPPEQFRYRPARIHPSLRMAMIDAIAESRNKLPPKHGTQISQWNPGGYISDSDNDHSDMEKELHRGDDWVGDLPQELRDNLVILERESIVEPDNISSGKPDTITSTTTTIATTPTTSATMTATVSTVPKPTDLIVLCDASGSSDRITVNAAQSTMPKPTDLIVLCDAAVSSDRITVNAAQSTMPKPTNLIVLCGASGSSDMITVNATHSGSSGDGAERSGAVFHPPTPPMTGSVLSLAGKSGSSRLSLDSTHSPSDLVVNSQPVSLSSRLDKSKMASASNSGSYMAGFGQSSMSSKWKAPEVVILESDDEDDGDYDCLQ